MLHIFTCREMERKKKSNSKNWVLNIFILYPSSCDLYGFNGHTLLIERVTFSFIQICVFGVYEKKKLLGVTPHKYTLTHINTIFKYFTA